MYHSLSQGHIRTPYPTVIHKAFHTAIRKAYPTAGRMGHPTVHLTAFPTVHRRASHGRSLTAFLTAVLSAKARQTGEVPEHLPVTAHLRATARAKPTLRAQANQSQTAQAAARAEAGTWVSQSAPRADIPPEHLPLWVSGRL